MFGKGNHKRRRSSFFRHYRVVFLVLILLAIVAAGQYIVTNVHLYGEIKQSEEICGQNRYTYRLCKICGKVSYQKNDEMVPHDYGETVNDIRFESAYATCTRCGHIERRNYTVPANIPRLYIEGTPDYPVSYATVTYEDQNGTQDFFAALRIARSGMRTREKDSYDVTLYSDDSYTDEVLGNFGAEVESTSVFTLKSEWSDATKIRNLAASELWEQTVMTRTSLPTAVESLSHLGADCGYPVLLYTNGNFKGIYDLCLGNDRSMFGFSERTNGALFYTYTDLGESDLTVDTPNGELPITVVHPTDVTRQGRYVESFVNLFDFAESADDRHFTQNIGRYLDVDAAIDYLIALYVFDLPDNAASYCNWVTYDGRKWLPSLYNLSDAYANEENRETLAPSVIDDRIDSGTGLALYDKLLSCYSSRVAERYAALRDGVLSQKNIRTVLRKQADRISSEVYDAECAEYATEGQSPADFADTFELHLEKVDAYFGYEPSSAE